MGFLVFVVANGSAISDSSPVRGAAMGAGGALGCAMGAGGALGCATGAGGALGCSFLLQVQSKNIATSAIPASFNIIEVPLS